MFYIDENFNINVNFKVEDLKDDVNYYIFTFEPLNINKENITEFLVCNKLKLNKKIIQVLNFKNYCKDTNVSKEYFVTALNSIYVKR
jgi:hypothetical protein